MATGKRTMATNPRYDIILSQATLQSINAYKNALSLNTIKPGAYLKHQLDNDRVDLNEISNEQFIELLLWTKKPIIFAEIETRGDGTDWNKEELKILGDLSVAMQVKIYDNGVWYTNDPKFIEYAEPINGTLLYVPGPLLDSSSMPRTTPDLQEILELNRIDQSKYNQLIDRRLTPVFHYINKSAAKQNVRAIVTIPGIGCGAFAGSFRGKMGKHLNLALQNILTEHSKSFENIACIRYDPHSECLNEERVFENVKYRVRPSVMNGGKSLLCKPIEYQEPGDNFVDCQLFKMVAWDHVSFPGNDFFGGSRSTDDGVSAAATNSMQIITGVEGKYERGKYLALGGKLWLKVVQEMGIKLEANSQNIFIPGVKEDVNSIENIA